MDESGGVKSITRTNFKKDATSGSNIGLVDGKMYTIPELQLALNNKITNGTGYSNGFYPTINYS